MDAFPVGKTLPIWLLITFIAGCGGGGDTVQDAPMGDLDTPDQQCQSLGATGAFYRREPNPKLIAGTHMFSDSDLDTRLMNPDLVWDSSASVWHLYYESPHGDFSSAGISLIRHATSADLSTWTFSDTPALTPMDTGWEATGVAEPSVTFDPDAPANQRFTMAYTASGVLFVATSADGAVFTRAGTDGLALSIDEVYPDSSTGALGDPEIVRAGGTYHLWFSSTATGTSAAHGIGHATSTDAITWTVQEAPVRSLLRASSDLTSGYDAPAAVYDDVHCRWEMWFADATNTSSQPVQLDNASGVRHATSMNGTSWTIDAQTPDLTWDDTKAGEGQGLMAGEDVAIKSTGRYMIYPAFDDQDVPSGSMLPTGSGDTASVMTLNLAARDAPP
jgi:hypothetical protein